MWKCANCGAVSEDQFDSCWKCQTDKGENSISIVAPVESPDSVIAPDESYEAVTGFSVCPKCRSRKIIPNVRLLDRTEDAMCELTAVVYQHPEAMIFPGAHRSQIMGVVCGQCGYTELYAAQPEFLYNAYLKQRE